jgi:hypothetical protein
MSETLGALSVSIEISERRSSSQSARHRFSNKRHGYDALKSWRIAWKLDIERTVVKVDNTNMG